MSAHPKLVLVPATSSKGASNVVHISNTPSQSPSPRCTEWRDLMRRIVKNHGKGIPADASRPGVPEKEV